MGIQDRDYYQEWKSGRPTSPPGQDSAPVQSGRRFRIIDKVRVRPPHQEPERVFVQREQNYTIAVSLVLLVLALFCWLVYLGFRLLR